MNNEYIKIEQTGKQPIVVLASNRNFYAGRDGVKITEPTQEEILHFFPEEGKVEHKEPCNKGINPLAETELENALAANKQLAEESNEKTAKIAELTDELENVKVAHEHAKTELNNVKAAHDQTKSELEKAQKEIEKLKKA